MLDRGYPHGQPPVEGLSGESEASFPGSYHFTRVPGTHLCDSCQGHTCVTPLARPCHAAPGAPGRRPPGLSAFVILLCNLSV